MRKKEIHYDSKKKKHIYVDDSIRYRGIVNGKIANDIKNKNPNWKCNLDDFNRGENWFISGLSLDDAIISDRSNYSFVAGFNKEKRNQLVNEKLFELGREYFDKGCSIDDIPNKYRNNEYFINGYNDRMNKYKNR